MRLLKRTLKILLWIILILLVLVLILALYLKRTARIAPPAVRSKEALHWERRTLPGGGYQLGDNSLVQNTYGLYELQVSGAPFERGVITGKLSKELLESQEQAFTDQIRKMIPSERYLKFLKYLVGFMNRDLAENVPLEYQQEIYGISFSASEKFEWIGDNYSRQLNYHAAHDIGHALQNLMLVGCTSFAAWDEKTENGAMLLGRNFDFYVGDDFAKNKIVAFVRPEDGHNFAYVTWAGFTGVVSGMNDQGLTVTINAAKSSIPSGAATPVSLVAREILQYASDIDEAVAIAHRRSMFVSESFLIGSARDHKSVVVEKTPDTLAVYDPGRSDVICTNHYQSMLLAGEPENVEQMAGSASVYRYKRTRELLEAAYPLQPASLAAVLRDFRGLGGADIGLGNEKAVNQFIAHHAIIFMPDSLTFWVSTGPWQLGAFVGYDLRKVFSDDREAAGKRSAVVKGQRATEDPLTLADPKLTIPADPFLETDTFRRFMVYRRLKAEMEAGTATATGTGEAAMLDLPAFVRLNPQLYDTYRLAGDYSMRHGRYAEAIGYYQAALTKEIATMGEKEQLEEKLDKARKKLDKVQKRLG